MLYFAGGFACGMGGGDQELLVTDHDSFEQSSAIHDWSTGFFAHFKRPNVARQSDQPFATFAKSVADRFTPLGLGLQTCQFH